MTDSEPPQFSPIVGGIDRATRESMIGDDLAKHGNHAAARDHYAAAVELAPANARFQWQLGVCDDKLGHPHLAIQSFQQAARLDPRSAFAQASIAFWFLTNGVVDTALSLSAHALELAPGNHSIMQLRARVLEVAGDFDASFQMVRELFTAGYAPPATLSLYARLSKRYHREQEALKVIEHRLRLGDLSPIDAAGLHFAAGALLDSMARYDEAFAHARLANHIRRPPYNPAEHEHTFDALIAYFTRQRIASFPKASDQSQVPVFIVGMPRSGTSLVEQILASHPDIHGGGELDFMFQIWSGTLGMIGASQQDYPQCLDRLTLEQIDGMAQIYLQPLMAMNPRALRITDKLPLNFLHLGLIAILFPGARIIHCRRDPLDTCLSCYMTGFREGHDFKYDLATLGHFYRQYDRLMAHWKANLELPILDVRYEDLIADTERQSRRMVEFLNLPWNDNCLQFNQTIRPVATSSLHQVRQSIYRTSIQRWRHYEKYLRDLKTSLNYTTP